MDVIVVRPYLAGIASSGRSTDWPFRPQAPPARNRFNQNSLSLLACAKDWGGTVYAFVHIEKTAGSTLLSILRRSFGTRHCDIRLPLAKRPADDRDHKAIVDAADLRRVRRLYRNLLGISGHNVKPYADLHRECPELRFITILRDPIARFRSHFLNRAPGNSREDFERWIAQDWVHNWQTKMIAGVANAEKAIELLTSRFGFVGLTERFDESMVLLRNWFGDPAFCPLYKPLNRLSDKQRPRDLDRLQRDMSYLDSDSVRARLREANAEDQKVYDFVISTVYPRQSAAFAGDLPAAVSRFQQENQQVDRLVEPLWGRLMRNYIYKPLLHCRAI